MLKKAALIAGIFFAVIGIGGFLPFLVTNNKLIGLFRVDTIHNIVHLLSAAAFLIAAYRAEWSQVLFKVAGVVYALIAVVGFIAGSGGQVLGLFYVNTADNFLHLVLAIVFVYLGFTTPERSTAETVAPAA